MDTLFIFPVKYSNNDLLKIASRLLKNGLHTFQINQMCISYEVKDTLKEHLKTEVTKALQGFEIDQICFTI
jgi:hypothetical protein